MIFKSCLIMLMKNVAFFYVLYFYNYFLVARITDIAAEITSSHGLIEEIDFESNARQ